MKKIPKILLILVSSLSFLVSLFIFYFSRLTYHHFFYFPKTFKDSLSLPKTDHLNFLLLGVDKRDDFLEKTNTTDTIMILTKLVFISSLYLVTFGIFPSTTKSIKFIPPPVKPQILLKNLPIFRIILVVLPVKTLIKF